MTVDDDFENEQAEETRRKKGKGEAEGAGAIGRAKAPVSEASFELMKRFGLSRAAISEILRTWSHLVDEQLVRRLSDFARDTARASAHLLVSFDYKGGFALVTNFLSHLSDRGTVTPKAIPEKTPEGPR
jgi:hypothetical protein